MNLYISLNLYKHEKTNFYPPHFRATWLRLFLLLFLTSTVAFLGCDKAEEVVQQETLRVKQVQNLKSGKDIEDKDEKYKTNKTGQYVSKDVQVTGYEDGKERPTRPKYDILDYPTELKSMLADNDCGCEDSEDPGDNGGGGVVTSTFVTSEGIGHTGTSKYAIYDLKVIKSSSEGPLNGYCKINFDLNRGAGGKYIYLQFTRDLDKVQSSSRWVENPNMGRNMPVKDIHVVSQGIGTWPLFYDVYWTPIETKDAFGFHMPDLNDGAGGKYIYSYQEKGNNSNPVVKEVGILYGNSSSIQPSAGWIKRPWDLNEGADYIFFVLNINCIAHKFIVS